MVKTAEDALKFISEYADFFLADVNNEDNAIRFKEKHQMHKGMRILIDELIEVLR